MLNADIRKAIRKADLRSYQVAAQLGLSQSGFFYRLQSPLTKDQREEILDAIRALEEQEE